MSSGTPDAADAAAVAADLAWEPRAWPRDPTAQERLAGFVRALRAQLTAAEPVFPDFPGLELDLRGARLARAPFDGAELNGANLDDVDLSHAGLDEARLPGASLRRTTFTGASMRDADLSHADAQGALLDDCDLYELRAFRTDLRDARLRASNLAYALLTQADLRGADLRGATVGEWMTLEGARLAGARVDGLEGDVYGPIDVGDGDRSILLDAADLEAWFTAHGAPGIKARPRSTPPSPGPA